MSLILDASVTLAWIYADETTSAIRDIFDRIHGSGALVPALWRLEVANGLRSGIRSGRLDLAFRDQTLTDLGQMNITVDLETDQGAWTDILKISDSLRLTPYDAAYLELALRHGLPLASLDKQMRHAAATLGLETLDA